MSTGSTQIIVAHIRGNFGGPNRSVPNTGVRDEDVGTRTLGPGCWDEDEDEADQ